MSAILDDEVSETRALMDNLSGDALEAIRVAEEG